MARGVRREDQGVSLGSVIARKETERALLVEFEDETKDWIPKSQIHADSEVWREGQEGKLVVTEWFAEKRDEEAGVD